MVMKFFSDFDIFRPWMKLRDRKAREQHVTDVKHVVAPSLAKTSFALRDLVAVVGKAQIDSASVHLRLTEMEQIRPDAFRTVNNS